MKVTLEEKIMKEYFRMRHTQEVLQLIPQVSIYLELGKLLIIEDHFASDTSIFSEFDEF